MVKVGVQAVKEHGVRVLRSYTTWGPLVPAIGTRQSRLYTTSRWYRCQANAVEIEIWVPIVEVQARTSCRALQWAQPRSVRAEGSVRSGFSACLDWLRKGSHTLARLR